MKIYLRRVATGLKIDGINELLQDGYQTKEV